jgi:ankyrin repeat protein
MEYTPIAMGKASRGNKAEVARAIADGANLNAFLPIENSVGQFSLLMYAAGNGFDDAVLALLNQESLSINFCSPSLGLTAVHCAAMHGRLACLRCLCDHRADVNVCDARGFSPLYMAAVQGNAQCVQVLLDAGAYAADRNQEILLVAEQYGHTDVVDVLVAEGATNAGDWMGLTAQAAAAQNQEGRD